MMRINILFCFFTMPFFLDLNAQKVVINGREGDRPLSWDDFRGKPDKESGFGAYTFTFFKPQPGNFNLVGDTLVWDKPLEYRVELGENSWVKKDKKTDTLLQHEEGHFIIGKLLVLELNARMKNTTFLKRDYQQKINAIVKEVSDKYRALERDYDRETDHSKNRPAQWKWNRFFADELARLRSAG